MKAWSMDNRSGNTELEDFLAQSLGLKQLDQVGGNSADFVDDEGTRFELKTDKYALRTNSPAFFAEVEETTNGWTSSRPSGIVKQAQVADMFLLVCKVDGKYGVRCVPSTTMLSVVSQPKLQTRTTGVGANGNAAGRFAKGKLVPWTSFNDCEFIELPSTLDPLASKFAPRKI
jgi:hypothetical protein